MSKRKNVIVKNLPFIIGVFVCLIAAIVISLRWLVTNAGYLSAGFQHQQIIKEVAFVLIEMGPVVFLTGALSLCKNQDKMIVACNSGFVVFAGLNVYRFAKAFVYAVYLSHARWEYHYSGTTVMTIWHSEMAYFLVKMIACVINIGFMIILCILNNRTQKEKTRRLAPGLFFLVSGVVSIITNMVSYGTYMAFQNDTATSNMLRYFETYGYHLAPYLKEEALVGVTLSIALIIVAVMFFVSPILGNSEQTADKQE